MLGQGLAPRVENRSNADVCAEVVGVTGKLQFCRNVCIEGTCPEHRRFPRINTNTTPSALLLVAVVPDARPGKPDQQRHAQANCLRQFWTIVQTLPCPTTDRRMSDIAAT